MLSDVVKEIPVWVLQLISDRVSCWYFRRCVLVGINSNADEYFRRWYFSCDGFQGFATGRGFDPTGGAPGGG
ncbi:hypothetical protein F511_12433 [Dorcoceras hygrometricum]|uniref:Uncharacterized protein n=1 Tax=Dorcoceras hygrometricum TaxID=472368 RepID=A0A2Z7C2F5_9LAMI|nr:hypothetical protein F511_12433 [Dorcoceras hygrometricum]